MFSFFSKFGLKIIQSYNIATNNSRSFFSHNSQSSVT